MLVAIVAAVVMGMTSGVQSSKDVGVTVTPLNSTTDAASIIFYGGKDVGNLNSIQLINITGNKASNVTSGSFTIGTPAILGKNETGDFKGSTNVNLIGTFADGTTSVIYTGTITFP